MDIFPVLLYCLFLDYFFKLTASKSEFILGYYSPKSYLCQDFFSVSFLLYLCYNLFKYVTYYDNRNEERECL